MTTRGQRELKNESRVVAGRLALPVRTKILITLFVSAGACALAEGACRLLVRVAPNAGFEHHRRLLNTVGLPALNDILEPDPLLFWKLRPNLDRHLVTGSIPGGKGLHFSVSTDGDGRRRGGSAVPTSRLAIFLGDSCTFGLGVEDAETFPALLEQRSAGLTAWNAGVPGYTAFQGARCLETLRPARDPEVVVIAFGFNDAESWDDVGDGEHAARIDAETHRLVHRFRILEAIDGLLSRPPTDAPVPLGPMKRPRMTDEEYDRALRSIVAWCRVHRAQPVLLAWPYAIQMTTPVVKAKQAVLARVAREESVVLVDLVSIFRARGGARLFADVVHADAEGCRVVADAVREALPAIFRN